MKTLLAAILAILSFGSFARADDRPNIVLILCDDMGFSDLGSMPGLPEPEPERTINRSVPIRRHNLNSST